MKLYLYILLLLILYACHDGNTNVFNNNNNTIINQFPNTQAPLGEKIDLEIIGVNDLFVIDTFLITFKPSGYNNFFEIYSTTDYKYLGKCLSKGRGPNEFLSIQYLGEYSISNNDILLLISDGILQKGARLNLSQSLKQDTTICDTIFRTYNSDRSFSLNDSSYALFNPIPGNFNFTIQSNNKQIISETKLLRSFISKSTPNFLLSMGIIKHPTKNIFASNMLFFNQINIFSSDMKKNFSISYGSPINIFKTINQPDTSVILYYSSLVATSSYIYALYTNKKVDHFYHGTGSTEVQIFNWNGQPISKIIIPENIIYFGVDEKHKYIYGLKGNEEIFRYKFEIKSN